MSDKVHRVSDEVRAAIQARVLKHMVNQIKRGALDDVGLRNVTLHNVTNFIIKDVEDALHADRAS